MTSIGWNLELCSPSPGMSLSRAYLSWCAHTDVWLCRAAVAKLIGAETDEVVLVPNASHAYNVVLRNFEWREGDVIITGA